MADAIPMRLDRKEVDDWIKVAKQRGANLRPFFGQVAAILHTSTMLTFKAGGRPSRWQPLSPWTTAVRQASGTFGGHGLSQNILNASGRLRGSVGSVMEITQTTLTYGTNLKYAAIHQFGGVIRPRSAKYLALPFPGVTGKPRSYKNTFFRQSRAGNLILFQSTALKSVPVSRLKKEGGKLVPGKTGRRRLKTPIRGVIPLFLLKKSVTIPSRPFLLFQRQDTEQIAVLALAYQYDPDGYIRMAANTALGR